MIKVLLDNWALIRDETDWPPGCTAKLTGGAAKPDLPEALLWITGTNEEKPSNPLAQVDPSGG